MRRLLIAMTACICLLPALSVTVLADGAAAPGPIVLVSTGPATPGIATPVPDWGFDRGIAVPRLRAADQGRPQQPPMRLAHECRLCH